ncbi:hypothetical protein U27_06746 [Candidatus Vecturithrix granuli]|uniref:Uncharacterized protein n=1 Tax=Vecturithrix granuli TaxID=1499967 RepID=A0A081C5A6_VECG1|nr:hypothetical protein U27_06746 [Candidatus Vecturithrix granuli]
MDKAAEHDHDQQQTVQTQLTELFEDFKTHLAKLERRLARMETTFEELRDSFRIQNPSQTVGASHETIDKFITEHIQERLAGKEKERDIDIEGVQSNWNYFVAQKGGYDEVLYMTVQDFLNFDDEPVEFFSFLLEKRTEEVKESLQHLQTEYENLQGNQLQKHFTELWELHHNLLKKKVIRTWKEEIFLEAFEAFLLWIQET